MDALARSLVTFGERQDLRRASRLTSVMRCGAEILKESASAQSADASEAVETIDIFLSHNWAVSRLTKFLCLVLHFNLSIGVLFMGAGILFVVGAESMGVQFLHGRKWFLPEEGELDISSGCALSGPLLFLLSTFFGHELQRLFGLRGCTVFLDKTCIDQSDQERQRAGIRKLGAFLRRSSKMVVLYTDIYLTRLWTVYEVACFLSLHNTRHLVVISTYQPIMVFSFIAFAYTLLLGQIFFPGIFLGLDVLFTFYSLVFAAGFVLFRRWAREMEAIQRRVATFEVGQCSCTCEDDRPLLHKNIALLMRAGGLVGEGAAEPDALLAFNDFVRARLSRSLAASIGPVGLRYWHVVLMFFVIVVPLSFDIYVLGVPDAQAEWITRWRIGQALDVAIWVLGLYPLLVALMSKWCRLCLHLRGCGEVPFLCAGLALIMTIWQEAFGLLQDLAIATAMSDSRDAWAVVQVAVLIACIVLALCIYSQGRRLQEEEEVEEDEGDAAWGRMGRNRAATAVTWTVQLV